MSYGKTTMVDVIVRVTRVPQSCGMCECSGTSVCREWMKVNPKELGKKKADSCPIICVLPENHGRLADIDAEENIESIERDIPVRTDAWTKYTIAKDILSHLKTVYPEQNFEEDNEDEEDDDEY